MVVLVCLTEPAAPSLKHLPHHCHCSIPLSFSLFSPIYETMSHQQPRRPQSDQSRDQEGPIKYGDIFNVTGELASKSIASLNASAMQSAETTVLGQTQRSGPSAVMHFVGQYIQPKVPRDTTSFNNDPITVGEALKAAALSAVDKPIEQSDVAAIQAAERRATGCNETLFGGVAA
ncbi:late embryogenesis abundant protein D-34-like [Hibiscus syriacus]|uniref:late embryogenesis abundant protein D-34-like n=1 Tax=Hibiscus syriacus TaxID=106335 RepID=UPI0019216786|nr:late embryogenesis abundant protein D-34-like [Hibiscus syriacus]